MDDRSRSGFTVTELLVSMGVIGLLVAILLPAIQQARGTARVAQCKNNLHQIGLAAHSFHGQYGYVDTQSPLVRFLPFVEQTALFDKLEADYRRQSASISSNPTTPPVYACPDDYNLSFGKLEVSYLICNGSSIMPELKGAGFGRITNGEFARRFSNVIDGLSTTAMFAERISYFVAPANLQMARRYPLRAYWEGPREFLPGEEHLLLETLTDVNVKNDIRANGTTGPSVAISFLVMGADTTKYNHLLPPNNWTFRNDCVISGYACTGPIPSASYHTGGTNVLMGDGSVRFVSSLVDSNVWWAMGTIDSNDVADY